MYDGDYIFALGGRPEDGLPFWQLSPKHLARRIYRRLVHSIKHQSGSKEYGYESYSRKELEQARHLFVRKLRLVAQKGVLALVLHDTPLVEPFVLAILDWLDTNQVPVNRHNYYHFYRVYTLMYGPARYRLLRDRRVLVVTGLTDQKRAGIEAGLKRVGAADAQFLAISSSKSIVEALDLSSVNIPIDVALVGVGVGTVNILAQLESLQTVCFEVGFALSTLANPELRWRRPFCVPDDEFERGEAQWLK